MGNRFEPLSYIDSPAESINSIILNHVNKLVQYRVNCLYFNLGFG